jgi:hypothetical protein
MSCNYSFFFFQKFLTNSANTEIANWFTMGRNKRNLKSVPHNSPVMSSSLFCDSLASNLLRPPPPPPSLNHFSIYFPYPHSTSRSLSANFYPLPTFSYAYIINFSLIFFIVTSCNLRYGYQPS